MVEDTRSHASQVAGKGIDGFVGHHAQIIRRPDALPIGTRNCRIARVALPHTFSLACMPLTVAAIVNSVVPSGSRAALNAESACLTQVLMKPTVARRSC